MSEPVIVNGGTIARYGDRLVCRDESGRLLHRFTHNETMALFVLARELQFHQVEGDYCQLPGDCAALSVRSKGRTSTHCDLSFSSGGIQHLYLARLTTLQEEVRDQLGNTEFLRRWNSFDWSPRKGWLKTGWQAVAQNGQLSG